MLHHTRANGHYILTIVFRECSCSFIFIYFTKQKGFLPAVATAMSGGFAVCGVHGRGTPTSPPPLSHNQHHHHHLRHTHLYRTHPNHTHPNRSHPNHTHPNHTHLIRHGLLPNELEGTVVQSAPVGRDRVSAVVFSLASRPGSPRPSLLPPESRGDRVLRPSLPRSRGKPSSLAGRGKTAL